MHFDKNVMNFITLDRNLMSELREVEAIKSLIEIIDILFLAYDLLGRNPDQLIAKVWVISLSAIHIYEVSNLNVIFFVILFEQNFIVRDSSDPDWRTREVRRWLLFNLCGGVLSRNEILKLLIQYSLYHNR